MTYHRFGNKIFKYDNKNKNPYVYKNGKWVFNSIFYWNYLSDFTEYTLDDFPEVSEKEAMRLLKSGECI